MKFSTYLTCPHCKDEDASEDAEEAAVAHEKVECRTCGKKYKAVFSDIDDGFFCEEIK